MARIFSGVGSLAQLGKLRSEYEGKNILLVTGKGSYAACGAKVVVDDVLADENILHFSDFDVNPKIEDAERGVELARAANVNLIVAIGGGSVMDMAKLIKAFYATPELSRELARGEAKMVDPDIPMILVTTTAGSGSEATHFAVVYIGLDKYSLASQLLLPQAVILDARLIATGTSYQKACNGLDALAQAIESAWAAGSTAESRANSFKAVRLCANYLKKVIQDDADDAALQGMIDAANLAGQAINISKTTAAHAWSYGITSHYGVPHGHAVWLTLPMIFQMHAQAGGAKVTDPRGAEHVTNIMKQLMEILGIPSAEQAGTVLREYLTGLNVQLNMAEIGADTFEKRAFLSLQVNMQRMSNNPVGLDEDDINAIFAL